ncbi:MAG: glycoside hydrolase family 9 protein [Paludibacter sp.]
MRKRIILVLLSIFCISMLTYGVDAWIRINQLGYLPNAQKKAILISESFRQVNQFSIHDALTNQELAKFYFITDKGKFQSFRSTYVLDFSSFKSQGAFYIKAGLIYSPTIYINKNVYLGTADFLLNYLRQQRYQSNSQNDSDSNQLPDFVAFDPEQNPSAVKPSEEKSIKNKDEIIPTTKTPAKKAKPAKKTDETTVQPKPEPVDVKGGWYDGVNNTQSGITLATATHQMLFAYQMNPASFTDQHNANGNPGANGIPDILDEAKWGLDWLLKMYPDKDHLYHQISDKPENMIESGRTIFPANGKPQGLSEHKNQSTGIASIAGKYSAAFALGAEIFGNYDQTFADTLKAKALNAYWLGKQNPGVCQSIPDKQSGFYEENNWTDDMELAATQLYRLTYEGNYLKEAAGFGRMEPVTPWMCSDTARHYQWYPFINMGHYMLANVENPRYQKEFELNLLNGIQRMNLYAGNNPFNIGTPIINCSNSLIVALATQCRLYRSITNDSTYIDLETGLTDWLFGRNPWGTSMITGMPAIGNTPAHTYQPGQDNPPTGGLVKGPVQTKTFKKHKDIKAQKNDRYEQFQSDWATYHDDRTDYITNAPTLDGTASLTYLLAAKQQEGVPAKTSDKNQYAYGGITRTDVSKKQISLVFCSNEFADGYKTIRKTLKKLNIKASFFFTGNFYRNGKFKRVIKGLQEDLHYLGGNSDKQLLYCSWRNRDSLLISKSQFLTDLRANYASMEKFNIHKNQAPFFFPSNDCYNDSISLWCREVGIQLVSATPGTLSGTDSSLPEMRERYFSSDEIYNKILQQETKQGGLNGAILMFNLGSDKRRQDKFHPRLYSLLIDLSKAGYDFVDLYNATDVVDKITVSDKKQKRKN